MLWHSSLSLPTGCQPPLGEAPGAELPTQMGFFLQASASPSFLEKEVRWAAQTRHHLHLEEADRTHSLGKYQIRLQTQCGSNAATSWPVLGSTEASVPPDSRVNILNFTDGGFIFCWVSQKQVAFSAALWIFFPSSYTDSSSFQTTTTWFPFSQEIQSYWCSLSCQSIFYNFGSCLEIRLNCW